MQVEKLTISLPHELVQLTDAIAKQRKVSRSKVVSECIREMARKKLEEEMIEGYKTMTKANLKFAEESIHLAKDIVDKE